MSKTKIILLGIPLSLGAETLGVALAPNAFRDQQIVKKLSQCGFDITDEGNIESTDRQALPIENPKLKYLAEIVRISTLAAQKVHTKIKNGQKILVLNGDHSQCIGVISGASAALNGQLGLIYLDTHGDMNTEETTPTGNIHGMPLAALLGVGHPQLTNLYQPGQKIKQENLLHIGGRDFDEAEINLINKEKLTCFKMIDFLSHGLAPLLEHIKKLSKKTPNIWISLDLDVIDSTYSPAAAIPNKAGFTYREITAIADYIGKNCNIIGVDVNECNPLTDINNKTAELAIELIAKFFGSNYSDYTHYLSQNKT